ncbi:ATP synthase subunit I [Alteromonas sp. A081]|uniref:N-ATPase subunit AtpR n=1 Tax=Alteromonas sp. A081 TaxID=3410269 RepID=UPI003B97E945
MKKVVFIKKKTRKVMSELTNLLLVMLIGLTLGIFFYGGLWWTVQKSISSAHIAWWLLASFLIRTSVVLIGFYFMLKSDWLIPSWQALLIGILSFAGARFGITLISYLMAQSSIDSSKGAKHAP